MVLTSTDLTLPDQTSMAFAGGWELG